MIAETVIAVAFISACFVAQYRYAMLGSPASPRWRLLLFILGAGMGAAGSYLLFTMLGITESLVEQEQQGILVATVLATVAGGVASAWFIPRGLRLSLEMAERNREKQL